MKHYNINKSKLTTSSTIKKVTKYKEKLKYWIKGSHSKKCNMQCPQWKDNNICEVEYNDPLTGDACGALSSRVFGRES